MSAGRDRAWIATHLPHRGSMSLLDEVVAWDAEHLHARATGHRRPDHPLRRDGVLPIACAIEYGAQAVAAHGALLAPGESSSGVGYLVAVRSVAFHADRLDDIDETLEVRVQRLGGGAGGVAYEFRVSACQRPLADGRITIVLDAAHTPGGRGE